MDPSQLPGSVKVAILIQSMDKMAADKLLNKMDASEKELIIKHLSQMGPISPNLVEKVSEEFTELVSKNSQQLALGEGKNAKNSSPSSSYFKNLESLAPDQIMNLIKDEHPQTISIILTHLKTDVASKVLTQLPDELKADVSLRIANLNQVNAGMVQEIASVFEGVLKETETEEIHDTGGVNHLADMLNQMEGTSSQLILDEIEKENADLFAEIKGQMFVFEDLILIDDRGLQNVLRSVEKSELAIALKAATEDVKEKIFKNMSQRAAEMLKEEIAEMGPVRIKEVEDAQSAITKVVQQLEEKGELVISGRGGEDFIA